MGRHLVDLDLTRLQTNFPVWFWGDLLINRGFYMARNDPGLEGFNLIYQLCATMLKRVILG